jgi:DNA-directed RNA polymerase subunit H (RpoH/RPB5)
MTTVLSGHTQTLYKSRKTILEHLDRQGYNSDPYEDFSINDVNNMNSTNQMDMCLSDKTDITKKTYVKYFLSKSMRPTYITEIVEDLYNIDHILKSNDMLIIISKDVPNESLLSYLKQIYTDQGLYIVILSLKQLQFNIMVHTLVPEYIKMTEQEIIEFKDKYNIGSIDNIPSLSRFDPVSIVNGIRPGDIVKIIRSSKSSVNSIYYRNCLNI